MWRHIPPGSSVAAIRIAVDVTQLTSVAFAGSGSTTIYQLSRDELPLVRCGFATATNTHQMQGNVTGIPGNALFMMSYGRYGSSRQGPGSYSLLVKDTVATLIASMRPSGGSGPTQFLVTREFQSAGLTSLPTMDFASPAVVPLDSTLLSITGIGGEPGRFTTFYSGGASQLVETRFGQPAQFLFALKQAPVAAEYYLLRLTVPLREMQYFYKGLSANPALAFGPEAASMAAETFSTQPCKRVRAQLPVQAEYPAAARISFSVSAGRSQTTVSVLTTAAFRGGNPAWVADVPEIPDRQCLLPGSQTLILTATVYDWNPLRPIVGPPVADTILRQASSSRAGP